MQSVLPTISPTKMPMKEAVTSHPLWLGQKLIDLSPVQEHLNRGDSGTIHPWGMPQLIWESFLHLKKKKLKKLLWPKYQPLQHGSIQQKIWEWNCPKKMGNVYFINCLQKLKRYSKSLAKYEARQHTLLPKSISTYSSNL